MNYKETIDYLTGRLPMFSRVGSAAFKKDLTNTFKLCSYLGDPQKKFKSIHVAGTNGKGSVSHMLAAILQTAGYKTGLYTSPHLKDLRERIKVSGKMTEEKFVTDFTNRIRSLAEEIEPSFFEITVAMAFEYFAEQKVDVAVIEVGLGGRFDSTNVITPELSVITNIGWDHMNMLGDSLDKIAFEKAGIIKENIPAVVGEVLPETKDVFIQKAKEKNAPLSIASQRRQATNWHWEKQELVVEVSEQHKTDHQIYHLDLTGIYQVKNLLTVLEACFQLRQLGWNTGEKIMQKALTNVKKITGLHGRWEIIHHKPDVVLDVAHNVDGIKQIAEQIEVTDYRQLHLIIGMVKDKEVEKVISLLPREADYYFTKAHIPRALPEDQLAIKAKSIGLEGETFADVNTALQAALAKAHKEDLILICGSVFLVGEVNFPS
ncbi:MAG: bifunctional folylpolyglutamate synthase/dihydrofolate synthase [Chitinophagaceae bacterium]|nr:bifunctional folylpolyglutamate synthase/dihydrofolate synthase [Chitinophagaceae bacterium]